MPAFISWTCMRCVSKSAVGWSWAAAAAGNPSRAVRTIVLVNANMHLHRRAPVIGGTGAL